MIRPDMTLREVFELMDEIEIACIHLTLDDASGTPFQGMCFTDGKDVTQKVMGAAKVAKDAWESEPIKIKPGKLKPSRTKKDPA
jgi:hypothetical protein